MATDKGLMRLVDDWWAPAWPDPQLGPAAPMLWTIGHASYEGQGAYEGLTYTVMFFREIDVSNISPDPSIPGVYLASGWIDSKD